MQYYFVGLSLTLKKYGCDAVHGPSRRITRFLRMIGGFLCKSQGESTTRGHGDEVCFWEQQGE